MFPTHNRLISVINSIIHFAIRFLLILSLFSLLCVFFIDNAHAYTVSIRTTQQEIGTQYQAKGWVWDYTVVEEMDIWHQIDIYLELRKVLEKIYIPHDLELEIIIDNQFLEINDMRVRGIYYKKQIYLLNRDISRVQETFAHELGHAIQRQYNISLEEYLSFVYDDEYVEYKSWALRAQEEFAEDFKKYIFPDSYKRTHRKYSKKFEKFLRRYCDEY